MYFYKFFADISHKRSLGQDIFHEKHHNAGLYLVIRIF